MGFLSDLGNSNSLANLQAQITPGFNRLMAEREVAAKQPLEFALQERKQIQEEFALKNEAAKMAMLVEDEKRKAAADKRTAEEHAYKTRWVPYKSWIASESERKPEQTKAVDDYLRSRGLITSTEAGEHIRAEALSAAMQDFFKGGDALYKYRTGRVVDMEASKNKTIAEIQKLREQIKQSPDPKAAEKLALLEERNKQQSLAYSQLVDAAMQSSPEYRKVRDGAQAKFDAPQTMNVSAGANVGVMEGGAFTPTYSAPTKPEAPGRLQGSAMERQVTTKTRLDEKAAAGGVLTDDEKLALDTANEFIKLSRMTSPSVQGAVEVDGVPNFVISDQKGGAFKLRPVPGGQMPSQSKLGRVPSAEAKALGSMDTLRQDIGKIKEEYTAALSGPFQGRAKDLANKVANGPEFERFRRKVGRLITVVYGLSGKQINESEMKIFQTEILPSIKQPDQNFLAAVDEFDDWVRRNIENTTNSFSRMGYDTSAPGVKEGAKGAITPRKPGETVADYIKRTNK